MANSKGETYSFAVFNLLRMAKASSQLFIQVIVQQRKQVAACAGAFMNPMRTIWIDEL